jgi:hypothetical protein
MTIHREVESLYHTNRVKHTRRRFFRGEITAKEFLSDLGFEIFGVYDGKRLAWLLIMDTKEGFTPNLIYVISYDSIKEFKLFEHEDESSHPSLEAIKLFYRERFTSG